MICSSHFLKLKKEDIDSFEPCQTFINPDDLSRTFDAKVGVATSFFIILLATP
jgi:hypothetical protein